MGDNTSYNTIYCSISRARKESRVNKPIDINADCKFLKDLEDNSTNVNLGMYNLICSKRDLMLYCKGIKPHRRWKISSVKEYFGMNGNKHDLSNKLNLLYEILTERS